MKWTASAALFATAFFAGTGQAQNFTYRANISWNSAATGGSSHTAGGLAGQLASLTGPVNSRLGGFGIAGYSNFGYRLNGSFNNYAAFGNGSFGVFGTGSSFATGGFGSGYFLANLMPQIHQHGPLYNYGPYYGYPPFEPYGPWDAYLRYHPPVYPTGDDCGGGRCRGNPHPLCGGLGKRRTTDGCSAANDVACGGLASATTGHGWGGASGDCAGHAAAASPCDSAAARIAGTPVGSRFAGCGSPAASSAYYTGCPCPSVDPCATPAPVVTTTPPATTTIVPPTTTTAPTALPGTSIPMNLPPAPEKK